MNKLEELKLNIDALLDSVSEDKEFFSSIFTFVKELQSLLEEDEDVSKEKLFFLIKKIENFFQEYRYTDDIDFPYIPPSEISKNDNLVKEIFRLGKEFYHMPNEVFEQLKSECFRNKRSASSMPEQNTISILELLCYRFHKVVRQLRNRYNNRPTIEIKDEYDVQDLFHTLLVIFFDDIRKEEWTPSYAGACSRVDFLLKNEQIILEIKKTRKGLGAKEIGKQLLVDIQRYKTHPDCKYLVCFIYDPEGIISNPIGIENDLSGDREGIYVKAYVFPKD